jgi:hypothetical protein
MRRFYSSILLISILLSACQSDQQKKSNFNYSIYKIVFSPDLILKDSRIKGIFYEYIRSVEHRPFMKNMKVYGKYNILYQIVARKMCEDEMEIKLCCVGANEFALKRFPPSGYFIMYNRIFLVYTGLEGICNNSNLLNEEIKSSFPYYLTSEPQELIDLNTITRLIEIKGSTIKTGTTVFNPFGICKAPDIDFRKPDN